MRKDERGNEKPLISLHVFWNAEVIISGGSWLWHSLMYERIMHNINACFNFLYPIIILKEQYTVFLCTKSICISYLALASSTLCTSVRYMSVFFFFTDSSLQASQQGTKMQGVTKKEEKRRIEAKESDTSTTRPRYETSSDE